MITPTDRTSRLLTPEVIHLKRMLITDIVITKRAPHILYQVPFELTKYPSNIWKQELMDSWQSTIQHKKFISESVMWVFHNRILIDNISNKLVSVELENQVVMAIEKTNKQMKLKSKLVI